MKHFLLSLLSLFLICNLAGEEPTGFRDWTSAKGQTINANITALKDDMVSITFSSGKTIDSAISLFAESDIEFIRSHFAQKKVVATPTKPKGKGKGKKGKSKNPVLPQSSGENTKFHYFVPSTAIDNPPALFWTSGGRPGNASDLARFIPASELTGVVLVCCGDSSNSGKQNTTVMHTNLTKAFEKLSIDKHRLITSGTSGGAARCFYNNGNFNAIGSIPSVGYIPSGAKPSKKGFYFVITGAYDYNRYTSASAASKFGKNSTMRFNPGGHGTGTPHALCDGLIWVYTRHIYSGGGDAVEKQQFEERFYEYLTTGTLADKPWEAYYWTDHLLNACRISGSTRAKFAELNKNLASDPENLRYADALEDIEKFALKLFAPLGSGSRHKHTTKEIGAGAKKLVSKHGDVPRVGEVIKQFSRKTD